MGETEEIAAGAVVVKWCPAGPRLLVILDRFGRWALPKGHVDPGESPREAAIREVREETGVRAEAGAHLGTTQYRFWKRGHLRRKRVDYFLADHRGGELRAAPGEVARARWVDPGTFAERMDYPGNALIYRAALDRIGAQECERADPKNRIRPGRDGEI